MCLVAVAWINVAPFYRQQPTQRYWNASVSVYHRDERNECVLRSNASRVRILSNTLTPEECVLSGGGADLCCSFSQAATHSKVMMEIHGSTCWFTSGHLLVRRNPSILSSRGLLNHPAISLGRAEIIRSTVNHLRSSKLFVLRVIKLYIITLKEP